VSPPASVDRKPVTEHLLAAELLAAFPGATEVVLDDDGWTTVAEGPYGTLAIRDLPPDRGVPDDALWEALE
jgi:hypothetical protein